MGLSLKKPSRERSEKQAKDAAEKLGAGEKRIVADVPERIHRQMRVKCLQRGDARAGLHPRAACKRRDSLAPPVTRVPTYAGNAGTAGPSSPVRGAAGRNACALAHDASG